LCPVKSLTGIGVLDLAAQRGLVDLKLVFERLRRTRFRSPEEIMKALVEEQKRAGS
jgi:hypothetical protein